MSTSSRIMENVPENVTVPLENTKNNKLALQELQNLKIISDGVQIADYEENVVVEEQPFTISARANRVLPVYTLDWTSRTDSYFLPVTGLDFLIGVPEVLLFQATDNLKTRDSSFVVKIPNGETIYLGMENSTSMQRALFCSQRSFNMAFLDPNKQLAVTFIRKAALMSFGTFFKQELEAFTAESNIPFGKIQQDHSLSAVSFAILNDHSKQIYKLVSNQSNMLKRLNHDVHFSILDPVDRTGGVILHKWDNDHRDFVHHITFPSRDTPLQHKMLLIGAALLVEYTYFKATGCFCFS